MNKGIIIGGSIAVVLGTIAYFLNKKRNTPSLEAYDDIKKTVSYKYKGKYYPAVNVTTTAINISKNWVIDPIIDSKTGAAVMGVMLKKDGVIKEQLPLATN